MKFYADWSTLAKFAKILRWILVAVLVIATTGISDAAVIKVVEAGTGLPIADTEVYLVQRKQEPANQGQFVGEIDDGNGCQCNMATSPKRYLKISLSPSASYAYRASKAIARWEGKDHTFKLPRRIGIATVDLQAVRLNISILSERGRFADAALLASATSAEFIGVDPEISGRFSALSVYLASKTEELKTGVPLYGVNGGNVGMSPDFERRLETFQELNVKRARKGALDSPTLEALKPTLTWPEIKRLQIKRLDEDVPKRPLDERIWIRGGTPNPAVVFVPESPRTRAAQIAVIDDLSRKGQHADAAWLAFKCSARYGGGQEPPPELLKKVYSQLGAEVDVSEVFEPSSTTIYPSTELTRAVNEMSGKKNLLTPIGTAQIRALSSGTEYTSLILKKVAEQSPELEPDP